MKNLFKISLLILLSISIQTYTTRANDLPPRIYGVTVDNVSKLNYIVDSLSNLPKTPTTRIVFDEFVPASDYEKAVTRIHSVSYIMGELLDSSAMHQYSVAQFKNRVNEYVNFYGNQIDIYEIGNEINGEWLGNNNDVVNKMIDAYHIVKDAGLTTELTLYYNERCWEKPANEMFRWAQENIPYEMKQNLDYVLISYYEDDCNGLQPDWQTVFNRLGEMFPNSKIGMGEIGTKRRRKKEEYIRRYYTMKINHPRYIGGYFWWYFKQDMVPRTKSLWSVLYDVWLNDSNPEPTPSPDPGECN